MAGWLLRWALETKSAAEELPLMWQILSPREREVAELFRQGLETEEIANELMISKETVKTHLYNAVRKLGLKKMDELRELPSSHKNLSG